MYKLLFICAILGCATALIGRTQSSGVRGKLLCNGSPARDVLVKLYDIDVAADDLLAEGKTDMNGEFQLSGHTDEVTDIEPKFNIYHDCNDGETACQRKFTIKIPQEYITEAKVPAKVYNAGTIELSGKFPDEARDCVH